MRVVIHPPLAKTINGLSNPFPKRTPPVPEKSTHPKFYLGAGHQSINPRHSTSRTVYTHPTRSHLYRLKKSSSDEAGNDGQALNARAAGSAGDDGSRGLGAAGGGGEGDGADGGLGLDGGLGRLGLLLGNGADGSVDGGLNRGAGRAVGDGGRAVGDGTGGGGGHGAGGRLARGRGDVAAGRGGGGLLLLLGAGLRLLGGLGGLSAGGSSGGGRGGGGGDVGDAGAGRAEGLDVLAVAELLRDRVGVLVGLSEEFRAESLGVLGEARVDQVVVAVVGVLVLGLVIYTGRARAVSEIGRHTHWGYS